MRSDGPVLAPAMAGPSERPPVFSVTPEPTISHSAHGQRSASARTETSAPDDFAALLDGNANTERPASPAPDSPPKRASAGETRSRSDAAPAPTPKSPSATDAAPDATEAPADAAATTNPATGAHAPASQLEALADAATLTPDDAAGSEDTPATDADIAALETAAPVVVIPLMVAAEDSAPTGDDAQTVETAGVDVSASRAPTVLSPANAVSVQTEVSEAALAGLPVDADAPTEVADAATTPAPGNGKAKIKAAPVTADAGTRIDARAVNTDATTPTSGQPANTDAAPHGTQHAEAKHGEARQTADASSAQDTEKPAVRPAVDHRAPIAAASHDAALDPALPATGQTAQPIHIQTSTANAAVAQAPQLNVMSAGTMAVPLNGLAMDIALRAAGGSSRFEIRLDPAELGRIDVRLDVDKHGNVTSHLTVERPATLDMLRNDAPRLQQALEDAGLKTGDGGLQFSLRDQSSSGRQDDGQPGRSSQRLVITEDDPVPPQIAGRSYGRMLGASGGVDIRV